MPCRVHAIFRQPWHYRRGQLREEYRNLLPEAPLEIPRMGH